MNWTRFLFTLLITFIVGSGGMGCSASSGSSGTNVTAVALDLSPPLLALAAGTSKDVKATVTYSDGTTKDVTDASWTSSKADLVTVAAGKVTGLKPGAASVTAKSGELTKTIGVTVTAANLVSLGITPTAPSLAKGLTKPLVATGTFSDATTQDLTSQVTWSTENAAVVSVSTAGLVTAASVGTANIGAAFNGVAASTPVTVTNATISAIGLTPAAPSIAKGFQQQLAATATFTDGTKQDITTQAAWSSSATTTASVDTAGLVLAAAAGPATITATLGGASGSTLVTVTDAVLVSIGVTPATPSVAKGLTKDFTATGVFSDNSTQNLTDQVTWESSDQTKATISNASGSHGRATTLAIGETTITAKLGTITNHTTLEVTAAELVSIGVTPATPSVAKGLQQQFTATGTYTDNTNEDLTAQVTWDSSDETKAEISNAAGSHGLVTTLAVGPTTISATLGTVKGSTALAVTAAELVAIGVTPATPSVAKGLEQQFTATGTYTDTSMQDLTVQVTWESSDESKATISNASGTNGLASTAAVGTTTITAKLGSVSGTTTLDVTAAELVAIGVTPATPSVAKGLDQQFTATGTYTDASKQDLTAQVTWESSDESKATISNAAGSHGLASTAAVGTTTITAKLGSVSGNTTLEVTVAELVSIGVTPATPSVAKGLTQQFTATGTYTDTSKQDLTAQVTWKSSDESKATISNAAGSHGLASTLAVGDTTISAAIGAIAGSTTLKVTAAELVAIGVTPATPSVAKGLTQQFTATGTYTDTSKQDLTAQVTWESSDTSKATISNAAGSHGLASTAAIGTTTITAKLGSVSGSTTLNVTAAALVSIGVTPAKPSLAKGLKQQFTATGVYTDATLSDLTTQVTWESSDVSKATISNAAGSNGFLSTLAVGETTVTAKLGSISGTTTLEVTAAELLSIAVTPSNPSVAKGLTQQFIATGTYTDGTQVVTTQVTWESSDTSKATISNAGGSEGLASMANIGTTTISAKLNSVTGSATLTVSPAALVSIAVTPSAPSVAKGLKQQFTATGTYTDATLLDLTSQVTWESSDTSKATISNAAGSSGLASTANIGTTTITAKQGGVVGNTTLTVSAAALVSIAVTPASSTVTINGTKQFTASGTYTDTSVLNLTAQVVWASSNATAATISNAAGSQGLATAGSTVGISTTITATQGSVSGSTTLGVVSDSLIGSVLVTDAQAAQINAWIGVTGRAWQLCYRRSTHGSSASTFHAQCDSATETITVVKTHAGTAQERLIGAYSNLDWTGSGYKSSTVPFLFSLTNNFKHAATNYVGSLGQYAVYTHPSYGPTFGGGHDLYIGGSGTLGANAYCNIGLSYSCRTGAYGSNQCRDDFCGTYQPVVNEIEVYKP